MQRNRLKHAPRVLVHSDERACCGVHISRAEIVQARKAVILLAAVEIAVLGVADLLGKVAERVKGVEIGSRAVLIGQNTHGIESVIEIIRLCAVSLLRDKLRAAGVIGFQRAVLVILRKHLRKRTVGVDKIVNGVELGHFGYTVARIVIAIFLNIYLLSALNGNSDEPVLRVVGVGRGLLALGFLDEISVEIILVGNARLGNKLIQLVISVLGNIAVNRLCKAVAVAVVGEIISLFSCRETH